LASHNPFADNGIKLFAAGGSKLADDVEGRLEAELVTSSSSVMPTGAEVGRMRTDAEAADWYQRRLLAGLEGRQLQGIRVAVDCANGAAAAVAPEVLASAGAEVVAVLGAEPDGININAGCGSTYPAGLQAAWLPTAPMWGWPSTATPTGSSPSTSGAPSSTATSSSPSSPSTCGLGAA
jgi:phosphoglucosamine mutase